MAAEASDTAAGRGLLRGGTRGLRDLPPRWTAWAAGHFPLLRWVALGAVFLAGMTLFPRQAGYQRATYALGAVLAKAVIAEFDFPIRKDEQQLAREQQAAVAAVPPVLVMQDSVAVEAFAALERLERSIQDLVRSAPQIQPLDEPGIALSQNAYAVLLMQGTEAAFAEARRRLEEFFDRGLLSTELEQRLADSERAALAVKGIDWVGPRDRFVTPSRLRRDREAATDPHEQAVAELVEKFARSNVFLDEETTEQRRRLAREAVDRNIGTVLRGEEIVGAHQRIWQEDLARLESYEVERARRAEGLLVRERVFSLVGRALVLLLALGAMLQFLISYRRQLLDDTRDVFLLAGTFTVAFLLGGLILNALSFSGYLIPVAGFAVLLALLYDESLALISAGFITVTIGLVGGQGLEFIMILGLGAMVAILSVRHLRDRRQLYRLLLYVPLVHLTALGALGLVRSVPIDLLLGDALYLVSNPFIAAGFALFAVPLSEALFEKCTNLRLLELLDLNRPLLRRLMLEAPGTYHHSLMVGTLAETGAARIGANALLARVAGYYHDIGKLNKPDYFYENLRPGQKNPHDRLAPAMSRLILEAHLREGLALAKESKLPRVVRDAIAQHHATGLMSFFYHKALQKSPEVSETEYRYPGPCPQTREAAVLLLADQIDAASRALEDPTPSRLRGMVKQLIDRRAVEGELEESQLTLRDLSALREAFIPILTVLVRGRVSARIAYPSPGQLREQVKEAPRAKTGTHAESATKAEG
jgi:putative nucleotidyltransferase with HDIG domain